MARPLITLFIAVLCVRLGIVLADGVDMPFWDQWGRPLVLIFEPWLQGRLTAQMVLAQHNERRIVFTNLVDIALLTLTCNRWTLLPEIVVSQLAAYTSMVVLARALGGLLDERARGEDGGSGWGWRLC